MIPLYNIPKNDITIRPKVMIDEFNNILNNIKASINYYNDEIYMKVFLMVVREIKYNINKQHFWYLISSEKICSHVFTDNSNKFGNICGKRVDIVCNKDKYKCSEHVNKSHNPKKRSKTNKKICKELNKNKEPCNLEGKYEGYCIYHYKSVNNIDTINNTHKIIKEKEKYLLNIDSKHFKEYKNYLYNLDNYDNIIYQMYNSEYITYKKYLEKNNDDDYYSLIIKNTMNQSLYICPNCKDLLYEHEVGAKNGNYRLYNICNNCINMFDDNGMIRNDITTYTISTERGIIIKENNININEYIKEMISKSVNIDNLYNFIENNKKNSIEYILEPLKETINNIKDENLDFINKCEEIINYNIDLDINNNTNRYFFNCNDSYKVITNIINNNTYININYLEKVLICYNLKFKNFKKEIEDDFPDYYKRIKGYFEIQEDIFNEDIKRNIEFAKIKSIFI